MDKAFLGRGNRIKVDEYNRVIGMEDVFAIGDQCIMSGDKAFPNGHPQLAQVSIQQGKLLSKNLRRLIKGKSMTPFSYKNLGSMATVGRNKAVAEFSKIKLQGFIAWVLWLVVHIRSILGVRNKVIVLLNWIWNYFNYNQSLRMIFYPTKAKEVLEREAREAVTHWGEDLLNEENCEEKK
jgi:NADH:ubiquinone reductase (H+-translocating)